MNLLQRWITIHDFEHATFLVCKGQLISKYLFGVFKSTKRPKKYSEGFLPLSQKKVE